MLLVALFGLFLTGEVMAGRSENLQPVEQAETVQTEKNQSEPKELPKTGPAEMALSTLGLLLIAMAVVYWYRSEMMLKSQFELDQPDSEVDLS